MDLWLTCDGRPAHQVCVGEVQGGVEQEVRLDNPSSSLTDIVEQASAPHRHSALEAVLQGRKNKKHLQLFSDFFFLDIIQVSSNLYNKLEQM